MIARRIDEGSLKLPTPSASATRVLQLLRRDDIDPRSVARAVEKDPLLAAQIIRMANTLAFRRTGTTSSLNDAVVRLGTRQLKSFLVAAVAFELFISHDREIDDAVSAIRAHSVAVSLLARDLAYIIRCDQVEEAYLTGLFHDIGKVVVMVFVLEVLRSQSTYHRTLHIDKQDYMEAIRLLGARVGAMLVSQWELAPDLEGLIRESRYFNVTARVSVGNLVCFANAMTKKMGLSFGDQRHQEVQATVIVGRSILGLDEEVVERVCVGLDQRVKEI
ncbi:MAG: HDOD domain-containing protein [Deltaproteobacteria bacterium]|nr:HDOD domain-containing protein [Deltaproteobacteria bacterium]